VPAANTPLPPIDHPTIALLSPHLLFHPGIPSASPHPPDIACGHRSCPLEQGVSETRPSDRARPRPTKQCAEMVYRPRTKLVIARKQKRCDKCGKIVRMMKRCKRCHKPLAK